MAKTVQAIDYNHRKPKYFPTPRPVAQWPHHKFDLPICSNSELQEFTVTNDIKVGDKVTIQGIYGKQ